MENNVFLCKAEISNILDFLAFPEHGLERILRVRDLSDSERVYYQTRLDMFKNIASKLRKAYETEK